MRLPSCILYRNKKTKGVFGLEKVKKYFSGVIAEMKRIIWPTKQALMKNTGVSLGVIIATSAVLFGFDQIGQALVRIVLKLL